MKRGRPYEIAIIGMGCQFPGASDLSRFFENVLGGKDCTREVPPDRWHAQAFRDSRSRANDRLASSRGGYLESPVRFDEAVCGIKPSTAEGSEPEDFLVRDATLAALADAGFSLDSLDDLTEARFIVDAASACSLVVVDLAARVLIEKRANLAIAGGIYLGADGDFPQVFRRLNALSPSGTGRPFAEDADGVIPGEGVGVVVLKRRADAERDGDRIYAVIQGVGLAGDGQSQGLASPSARGHARAMRRAYRRAGVDPATVMLVEGHGLGVPDADRAELRALSAVFPALPYGRRTLGAVSSMIGHAMPAAGMAGLIKSALALYHRVLPPTLHADNAHPLLTGPSSAFALNPAARPWIHGNEDAPRRAGVNGFGFSGINVHVVLEEHTPSADSDRAGALRTWDTEAILLSAPDRAGLVDQVKELSSWLKSDTRHTLLDVAYSLNSRRQHSRTGTRLGLVASSLAELTDRLASVLPRLADPACRSIRDGRGIYYWDEPLLNASHAGLAFLFPGEGSQYPGMLADLCLHFPEVRLLFDTADRIARDLGETVPPSEHLFGPVAGGYEKLWSTATAVNVVLNAQWALYQVLTRLGLHPDAVLGHSSGEILALSAGGVFQTDRELERKLGRLGAIMRDFESSGDLPEARLVAVAAHSNRVQALFGDLGAGGVAIAMDNCPHQVVLAVPSALVARFPSVCASRTSCSRNFRSRERITRQASARSSARSPNSSKK